ncbi:hypothetical protein FACS1894216_14080 [Synergistales bacterium]|nr:hypothetical protein FACS1894216_14080 [Synergistales bacterium]
MLNNKFRNLRFIAAAVSVLAAVYFVFTGLSGHFNRDMKLRANDYKIAGGGGICLIPEAMLSSG